MIFTVQSGSVWLPEHLTLLHLVYVAFSLALSLSLHDASFLKPG